MDFIMTGLKLVLYLVVGGIALEFLFMIATAVIVGIGAIFSKCSIGDNYSDIKGDDDER